MKDQPLECQNHFSSPEFAELNWKSYSRACSTETDTTTESIDLAMGCFSELKDVGIYLGESIAQSNLDSEKLKECNRSHALKEKLLSDYNKGMPRVLKFDRPIDYTFTSCAEIQGAINRFHLNRKMKWMVKIPFYLKDAELTDDEKQFKKWLELKYAKNVFSQMNPTVFQELKELMNTIKCYNLFYKSKLFCSTLFSLTGVRLIQNFSKDIIRQRNNLIRSKYEEKIRRREDRVRQRMEDTEIEERLRRNRIAPLTAQERIELLKKIDRLEKEMGLDGR